MYLINDDVVFVKGALNGAIYDFNTHNVYSINDMACTIVDKLINGDTNLSPIEQDYKNQLVAAGLFNNTNRCQPYKPHVATKPELKMAWLEITQTCNLRCVHCYEGNSHISSSNTLTVEEWYKVIDQLALENVSRVVVIGGEPCCSKDVSKILKHLAQKGISTTLFSNGTLFTDELVQLMAEYNVLAKFSLYGHTAEIHDRITLVKGSFNKLMKTIEKLKAAHVRIDIAVVAMKENQDYQDEIKAFIESLGIRYHGYDVIRNVYGGTQNEHTPTNQELISSSTFSSPSFAAHKERFHNNYIKNSCWYGKLAIIETGDVLPCVFERNMTYGNVRENTIQDILHGDSVKENWYRDFSKVSFCKDCEYRFACKDCRPLALSCKGDIEDKNPRCLYNPYTGIWG